MHDYLPPNSVEVYPLDQGDDLRGDRRQTSLPWYQKSQQGGKGPRSNSVDDDARGTMRKRTRARVVWLPSTNTNSVGDDPAPVGASQPYHWTGLPPEQSTLLRYQSAWIPTSRANRSLRRQALQTSNKAAIGSDASSENSTASLARRVITQKDLRPLGLPPVSLSVDVPKTESASRPTSAKIKSTPQTSTTQSTLDLAPKLAPLRQHNGDANGLQQHPSAKLRGRIPRRNRRRPRRPENGAHSRTRGASCPQRICDDCTTENKRTTHRSWCVSTNSERWLR